MTFRHRSSNLLNAPPAPTADMLPAGVTSRRGFLRYPVSQAADITAFRATVVPVGDDRTPGNVRARETTGEVVVAVRRAFALT